MVLLRLSSLSTRGWLHPSMFGSLRTSVLAARPPVEPIRGAPTGGHRGIPNHPRPRGRHYTLRDGTSSSLQPLDAWVAPPIHVWKSPYLSFGRQTAHPAHPRSPHWRPPRYTQPSTPTRSPLPPERWYFFVSPASRRVGGSIHPCLEVSVPQFRPPDRPYPRHISLICIRCSSCYEHRSQDNDAGRD